MIEVRMLGAGEAYVLDRLAPGVFDRWIDRDAAAAFVDDPRLHLAVALDAGVVVGMASAVHYHHPDKPVPELWIDEVGVADTHLRRGLASRLLATLFDHARTLGCRSVWVLAEPDNAAATALYAKAAGRATPCLMYTFQVDGEAKRP